VRYRAEDLDLVIADIAASGYGLTLGIHTRIDATVERIIQRLPVGNIYVNRNMIGAVVGTQPFGGVGLSGTGPKAGGPNYVKRFASEQTVSINTAAAGGNATLLAQGD
jgi:RHH-type proline utilization regulon transcriptional repressor/proline dehydrogenase/delta 1-pyrroline-5-carboxylate dehydrogenase